MTAMKKDAAKVGFDADEVLEIAVQIEKNGADFYRRASRLLNGQSSLLMTGLAAKEEEHRKAFLDLREKWVPQHALVAAHDADGVVAAYLRAIAGGYVFPTGKRGAVHLRGDESPMDVVRIGIQAEKDSIVLYVGILGAILDARTKTVVERILREEEKHLADLGALMLELSQAR